MQHINLKPDDLDQQNRLFDQAPLERAVFLNSVPKSGSHLLRNIVRMFVPVAQQYQRDFIQHATLPQHMGAFDPSLPLLSWGHMLFSDLSVTATAGARKILLVRDPYDWVVARARFCLSDEFTGELDFLKTAPIEPDQLINMMIFGIHRKAPSLSEIYSHNAAAWLGTDIYLVRFEELIAVLGDLESPQAQTYFTALLEACGIAIPSDWKERVRIGSSREHSGTARENLSVAETRLRSELSDTQRALVDFACPGLRALLGYE